MTVSKAEVMLLEYKLRQLAPRMNVSLTCYQGQLTSTPYDHPVQFKWGSNSFHIERDTLRELMPLIDNEAETNCCWLADYIAPFITRYAG